MFGLTQRFILNVIPTSVERASVFFSSRAGRRDLALSFFVRVETKLERPERRAVGEGALPSHPVLHQQHHNRKQEDQGEYKRVVALFFHNRVPAPN